MHRIVTIPPDAPWLRHWKWLRFIPLNLTTAMAIIGFFIGRCINDPFGSVIGAFIGFAVGVPLQLIKGVCRGDDQVIDFDRRRNKLQLNVGVGCAFVGAVAGWYFTVGQIAQANAPAWVPYLATVIALVLGFTVGVLLSGMCLAFVDVTKKLRD